jgi:hypothetical protein
MQLDYANIIRAGQGLVPDLRQQMIEDAFLQQQQAETELRQNAAAQQQQMAEVQARQQAEFEDARDRAFLSGNPRQILALRDRFPEMSKGMKDTFDRLEEDERRDVLTGLGTVYARAQAGDEEGAAAYMRERVQADREAGMADPQDEAILAALESDNPAERKAATGMIAFVLASLQPDKFAETYGKVAPDDKTTALQSKVDYLRSIGRDDLAEQVLANEGAPDLVTVDAGGDVYRKSDFATGGRSNTSQRGGDPNGSRAGPTSLMPFERYMEIARQNGADEADAVIRATGSTVRVSTPEQAQMLPPGTRYITPQGEEYVR